MDEITIKPCEPSQVEQWQNFLNKCFEYGQGESFGVDFAPLFESDALPRSRLAWQNGEIVSTATLYKVVVLAPHLRLELGIIGAVATAEHARSKGYSRRILEELEAFARKENLDGLILWSEKSDHYAKLGFVPAGHQHILSLERLIKPTMTLPGSPKAGWDWAKVESLYEQHTSRCLRPPSYWDAIKKIKSVNKVQWVDKEGNVLAYLGFDRGRDMKGIIHEWGGEPRALHALISSLLKARPGLMLLTHPRLAGPISRLLPPDLTPIDSHLALFKPLKPDVTAKQLELVWFWGLDSL